MDQESRIYLSPAELDRLPYAQSSFGNIRGHGQIYVDKTDLIYALAATHRKYFISRPRRFGKTLLLSVFESLFSAGLRDFAELKISRLWQERATYQVLRLDFSQVERFADRGELLARLGRLLEKRMSSAGLPLPEGGSGSGTIIDRFDSLLSRAAPDSLVLLIDEYDAPLNHCLHDRRLFAEARAVLQDFYTAIKANEQALRFMFFTGIIRYRHTGLFSGFNIYQDLTMDPRYATLLGYTGEEIREYFGAYLEHAAAVLQISPAECLEQLRLHYDGFCFDRQALGSVYAPWSVLSFLSAPEQGFINYWYESAGTPALLVNYFRERLFSGELILNADQRLPLEELSSSREMQDISPLALLTQAGYFTIKSVDPDSGWAAVNCPNRELSDSIRRLYWQVLRGIGSSQAVTDIRKIFAEGDPQRIVAYLNDTLFLRADAMHYPFQGENAVRTTVQMCLAAAGLEPSIEARNAYGCSDLEVAVGGRYFVLEFKFCRTMRQPGLREGDADRREREAREERQARQLLDEAVEQLRSRRYREQAHPELEHVRLALVFSQSRRCLAYMRQL